MDLEAELESLGTEVDLTEREDAFVDSARPTVSARGSATRPGAPLEYLQPS